MPNLPDELIAGYRAFRTGRLAGERGRLAALAVSGQHPETMVIACCDSRAAPEMIFDASPGQLFVVRNVANLVPPYRPDGEFHATSAALEYAVQSLKVSNIVVLGHGRCGGIQAALAPAEEPLSPGDFIGRWVELLAPVAASLASASPMTMAERATALERINIRLAIENLRTFPWVADREREGTLRLHGAWFDIADGELWTCDPESGDFSQVE